MTQIVDGVLLLLSSSLAASILGKATVVATLGLLGAWLTRRSRAAMRHAVLAATFAVLLALPIASTFITPVRIALPASAQEWAPLSAFPVPVDATQPVGSVHESAVAAPVAPRWREASPTAVLLAVWIAGMAFFLLRMISGLQQVRALRRFGLPWRGGQSVVNRLALDAGIHRRVEVLLHESLPAPVTCGIVRPAIVLPLDTQEWEGEDLSRAIVHELEHVRRCDWMTHCLARIVCAVYWFHPLVWIAWRQLALEAERSCDDAVLGRSEATAYADQLVGLARRLAAAQPPVLAMANRSDLSARVGSVLDGSRARGRAGALLVTVACTAAAAVVLTMSPLRIVAAPQSPPAAVATPKFEVASIKPCRDSGPDGVGVRGAGSSPSSPGRLHLECANVGNVIKWAYLAFPNGERNGQMPSRPADKVLGLPGWIDSDHYTFDAKAEGLQDIAMMRGPMMQALLRDRFKLRIHHTTRVLPVYELRVVKASLKLQPAKGGNCTVVDNDHPPPLLPDPGQPFPSLCGWFQGRYMYGTTMGNLSQNLSARADRDVVDKTGLAGTFDLDFGSAPDLISPIPAEGFSGLRNPNDRVSAFYLDRLSRFGLKLVPAKGPTTVWVIDHIERPSDN